MKGSSVDYLFYLSAILHTAIYNHYCLKMVVNVFIYLFNSNNGKPRGKGFNGADLFDFCQG